MKPLPDQELEKLEALKQEFCAGDKGALREILKICFDEIFTNILMGKEDEWAGEMILLEYDILNKPDEFCQSTVPTYLYFQKIWKKIYASQRITPPVFHDNVEDKGAEDFPVFESPAPKKEIPIPIYYFLSSLPPFARMLYEVKHVQKLANRNGVYMVMHFLLNTVSIGNESLTRALQKDTVLYEPLISDHLINTSIAAFTAKNKNLKPKESLWELSNSLLKKGLNKKSPFVKQCKKIRMQVFRAYCSFTEISEQSAPLNYLERTLFFLNEYLPIEDPVEVWLKLNLDAIRDDLLRVELKELKLLFTNFKQRHQGLRRKALCKRMEIGDGKIKEITQILKTVQNNIDRKLNYPVQWKTN